MYKLKIRKIGNSAGVTLPKTLLAELNVAIGDELIVTKTRDGFVFTPYDPTFEEAMKAFEKGRRKYKNAMRQLAR